MIDIFFNELESSDKISVGLIFIIM